MQCYKRLGHNHKSEFLKENLWPFIVVFTRKGLYKNGVLKILILLTVKVLVAQWCLTLCDLWTVACQAPLSMKFSRQEYWSG